MTEAVRSGQIRAQDLARVVGSGLAAVFLAGTSLVYMDVPDLDSPWGWLLGVLFFAALLAAVSYRHIASMATAGAVLAGLGFSQILMMQIALRHFEVSPRRHNFLAMMPPTTLALLGCVLLGAALGWAVQHSNAAGKWSHYGVGRILGALALGAGLGYAFGRALEVEIHLGEVLQFPLLLLCVIVALGIGLLPALSPAGLLPALVLFIALWATGAPADFWWGEAVPVTLLVLLSVLTHFVGSVATTRITRPSHDRSLATPS